MIRPLAMTGMVALLLALAPRAAAAGTPVVYQLAGAPASFEWGCFAPCMCPIMVNSPLGGTFLLTPSHIDPLFAWYDVTDVRWTAPGSSAPTTITGSGTFRVGGEFAPQQELSLDLSFDGGPPRRFTTGLVIVGTGFPEITARASLHGEFCLDSLLAFTAKPIGTLGLDGGPFAIPLGASPSPFAGSTRIAFVLPRDGAVDLEIHDLLGRRVRSLARGQSMARGAHEVPWDGRLDDGRDAPAGLYLLRLETPAGRATRAIVKL